MAEIVTLSSPVSVQTSTYRVSYLELNVDGPGIVVKVRDNNGAEVRQAYSGATAQSLLSFLNTKNFGSTSLQKEIIKRLQTDGVIGAGSITGTPD